MTFLLALALVVIGLVAYVALRNAQDFSDANQIVPGVPTRAPKSWAGAHHPAAKMHRRLRDSIDALRANASLDDPSMAPVRAELEEQALVVDDRLVAVAQLPRSTREEPLQQVERSVAAIEQAVAGVVELRGPAVESVEQGIEAVRSRMELVESARAELEAMSPATPDLGASPAREALDVPSTTTEPAAGTTDEGPGTDGSGTRDDPVTEGGGQEPTGDESTGDDDRDEHGGMR